MDAKGLAQLTVLQEYRYGIIGSKQALLELEQIEDTYSDKDLFNREEYKVLPFKCQIPVTTFDIKPASSLVAEYLASELIKTPGVVKIDIEEERSLRDRRATVRAEMLALKRIK